MYISNDCVFPSDWTKETLLQRHQSRTYNPCIANAFFRAGYAESWGRGIQKICESCEAHGTAQPEYVVHTEDIMVKLTALPVAQNMDSKAPMLHYEALETKIIDLLIENNKLSQMDIVN